MEPEPYVGRRVVVSKPLTFGGGSSPWVGRKGTVKKLLTARAVLIKLDDDGDQDPFMFFLRELDLLPEGC